MQARMTNPALIVPDAMPALLAIGTVLKKSGAPPRLLELVHLRASQINGCSVCVDMHASYLKKAGETDDGSLPWRPGGRHPILPMPNARLWR